MEIKELLETRKEEFAKKQEAIKKMIEDLQEEVKTKNAEFQARNDNILNERIELTAIGWSIKDLESLI